MHRLRRLMFPLHIVTMAKHDFSYCGQTQAYVRTPAKCKETTVTEPNLKDYFINIHNKYAPHSDICYDGYFSRNKI